MSNDTEKTFHSSQLHKKDHIRVAEFIEKNAGIQMPESKKSLIEGRLRKRQVALNIDSLSEYIHFVLDTPEGEQEKIYFIDALTTNKTDFYREIRHFLFLRQHLIQQQGTNSTIKIWSAGCSTGEEPYTLAIEMLELQRSWPHFKFEIHATDISNKCIIHARKGIYNHQRIEPVDIELRRRYLLRSKNRAHDRVQMAPEVKKIVQFNFFNLMTGDWLAKQGRYDIIFCRNVMIYFNNNIKEKLSERFAQSLKKNGLLFIGHSETLIDPFQHFIRIEPTIYTKGG